MTRAEKRSFRFEIVQRDMKINFAYADFFAMDMSAIYKLADYAEIFHIKGQYGKSPARTLFDQMKKEWQSFIY